MSKFSERFRALKDESELTLKELSTALDISIPNLSYYMKGREPNYDTLIRIANYFNVTTDWLVGNDTEHNISQQDLINLRMENKMLSNKIAEIKNIYLNLWRICRLCDKIERKNKMTIEIPDWCVIGKYVEWNASHITGNEWVTEKIISYGIDGFFHKGSCCPVYYTQFSEYGKTIREINRNKNK